MSSRSSKSSQASLNLVPQTNSIKMYSVSAALYGVGEYPYTLGIGSPEERSKAIVATSLARAKYLGTVAGYGIRATIWKPPPMVMRKTRLKPPSASFAKSTISSGLRSTDCAASRHSPSTLKTRLRSAWRRASLMLNMLDYGLDMYAIERDLRPFPRSILEKRSLRACAVIESARRGGQRDGAAMELEREKYNELSEERGRRRDGETGAGSKSKTSLALPRQGMPIGLGSNTRRDSVRRLRLPSSTHLVWCINWKVRNCSGSFQISQSRWIRNSTLFGHRR
jgi:hypothetical protein